ncbi:hypothetical protein BU23DRAFT_568681 [Bimuria novae-zelandiae CBS 107.79]|uniref:Uncharacterized protein n=1 Tax=Bimuria novae-zelandiae CBS 107.79 TaxID=1447943 RepID=A0A6A5VA12_9PLEO|nr:hypothetical protein BU23DRAFT_568681 [Bimuria novae-zelandiae CBS 107.79]
MSFNSFPTQNFRFVSYNGPLEPKPTRRQHTKLILPNNHKYTALDEYPSTGLALLSHRAGDGLVSAGGNVCNLKIFSCKGDISCSCGSYPQDEQGIKIKHLVPRGTSKEALSEKSSGQPVLFEGGSLEFAIVIADNQSEPGADSDDDGYSHNPYLGTQKHDRFDDASLLTSDHHGTKGMEDAFSAELVGGYKSQVSRPPRRELLSTPSTPPTGSLIMEIGQPMQEANGETFWRAHTTMHQPQGPIYMKVEKQGESAPVESTSRNSSDGTEKDMNNDTSNQGTWLTRKRRRLLPGKPHTQTSSTTSKRHPRQARLLKTQRKPSSYGKPALSRPSGLKSLPAVPNCGHDSKICDSVDSSESSDRGRHLRNNKRQSGSNSPPVAAVAKCKLKCLPTLFLVLSPKHPCPSPPPSPQVALDREDGSWSTPTRVAHRPPRSGLCRRYQDQLEADRTLGLGLPCAERSSSVDAHYNAVVAMGAHTRALGAWAASVARNGIRARGHRDAGPLMGTTRGNINGPGG